MTQNAKNDKLSILNSRVLRSIKTWENLISGEISNSDTKRNKLTERFFKVNSKIVFFVFILLLK